MIATFQQALRPFFLICFTVGLGFCPKKQSKIWWFMYLRILYILIIWFTYSYLFYYIIKRFTIEVLFHTLVIKAVTAINIFTLIVSVIMSFYYQKRFVICLKKLAIVDNTLEDLSNSKMYGKVYRWSKKVVILWIIYIVTANFYESLLWQTVKEVASWTLCMPYILNHSLHINTFVDLLFIFLIWYIGTRFDKINENIRYLLVRDEQKLKCIQKKILIHCRYTSYHDNYKQILWLSMHLHLELCHLARELNTIFGTQITFEMASYFLYLTALCYYLCRKLIETHLEELFLEIFYLSYICYWIFLFSFKLYIVNHICEAVMVKANKNDKVIHQLTNVRQYAAISEEIYQFTLQIMQHPLRFSGMGLFHFGNAFLRKFYTTVIMFVIIMMQLKIS